MPAPFTDPEIGFWLKVRSSRNGCWEWDGCRAPSGHGQLTVMQTRYLAHRFSWIIHNGPIPHDMKVCHACDNPRCVRPSHLFLGSQADNMRDMALKSRGACGERSGVSNLTEDVVRAIRREYDAMPRNGRIASRGMTAALIAKYGVGRRSFFRIVNRETWSHLKD